jgi:RNA polymerase sigma factor (sigma-70 family)
MGSRVWHKKQDSGFALSGRQEADVAIRKRLSLVLSNISGRHPAQEAGTVFNTHEKENDLFDVTSSGLEAEGVSSPPFPAPSSIALYFKSISKYPLLNDEQEKSLARQIRHCEHELHRLIQQWCSMLRRNLLPLFPVTQRQEIMSLVFRKHQFVAVFEEIAQLLKDRRKIEPLKGRSCDSGEVSGEIQEAANRLQAEVSKRIAKIRVGESGIGLFFQDVELLPYRRPLFKKRKAIELEMRRILREIDGLAAEVKHMKNQMVNANLRLVISIAKKYLNQGVALADLIQEGNLGLMRAIDTYDYVRGHRLVTYATWWIKQAMIRAIDCQAKTVRTPVYVNEKINQIMKASNRLYQEWKREPTLSEIAEVTKTPLESLERVLKSAKDNIPLEYLVEDQIEGAAAAEDMQSRSIPAQVAADQLAHIVNDMVMSDLTDRERDIVRLRFGIGDEHDHTLEEIGRTFNLSRERIRQILETALRKMRTPEQLTLLREFANAN